MKKSKDYIEKQKVKEFFDWLEYCFGIKFLEKPNMRFIKEYQEKKKELLK